jgi:hypothetical protein
MGEVPGSIPGETHFYIIFCNLSFLTPCFSFHQTDGFCISLHLHLRSRNVTVHALRVNNVWLQANRIYQYSVGVPTQITGIKPPNTIMDPNTKHGR